MFIGLCAIQVLPEIFFSYQKSASTVALTATSHPFFNGMTRVNGGCLVRLQWGFFSFLLSSLSFLRNSCITLKTTVASSILWFYRFWPSFSWSLFYLAFDAFELLFFKFYSILFLIRYGPSTFNCSIYVFYTFLDYYVFTISPLSILLHLFS
jgi:hypothetical protein